MTLVARELRARSTRGEDLLWEGLRNRRLLGRKFRRQQPVGPFVLDFYCGEERLAVEVDGPVHEQQRAADAEGQALLETLGMRVRDDLVQTDLPSALRTISAAFGADGEIAAPDR
ncbi:MAG: endonuclease domain-containing protein [Dehalococcoidia bacterium]